MLVRRSAVRLHPDVNAHSASFVSACLWPLFLFEIMSAATLSSSHSSSLSSEQSSCPNNMTNNWILHTSGRPCYAIGTLPAVPSLVLSFVFACRQFTSLFCCGKLEVAPCSDVLLCTSEFLQFIHMNYSSTSNQALFKHSWKTAWACGPVCDFSNACLRLPAGDPDRRAVCHVGRLRKPGVEP